MESGGAGCTSGMYVRESSDGYQVVWDSIGSYLGKLLLPRCGFTLSLFDNHVVCVYISSATAAPL